MLIVLLTATFKLFTFQNYASSSGFVESVGAIEIKALSMN